MSRRTVTCYIAGPFFNPEQKLVIERLEGILEPFCDVFSPRKHGGTIGTEDQKFSPQEIFEVNYNAITSCDFMVAQVEALDVRAIEQTLKGIDGLGYGMTTKYGGIPLKDELIPDMIQSIRPRIPNYIDTGTVWEMGVAYEAGKPIIAFSPNPKRTMNVMLACSVRGFCSNYDEIIPAVEKILNGGTYGEFLGKYT